MKKFGRVGAGVLIAVISLCALGGPTFAVGTGTFGKDTGTSCGPLG